MRLYRNMKSRIEGVHRKKRHLYEGKALLSRAEFYEWAAAHEDFIRLYHLYKDSGYRRAAAPSVDRIDSALGYTLENMRWLTMAENSRLGQVAAAAVRRERRIRQAQTSGQSRT